jgi:hypothetical protein
VRRALLALLLFFALVPSAAANGDPASDILLTDDVFFPYAPPVSERLKTALKDVLKEARRSGYPMKVALINTEADLGAYPQLFNQPAAYSELLARELSTLNPHGDPLKEAHLLIVMPGGFGGANLGEGVDRALAEVTINPDGGSDGLAQAAMAAVARIATENGHPTDVPPEATLTLSDSEKGSGGGTSALVFLAPALLLFAGLFIAGRISARRKSTPDAGTEPR